MAVTYARFLWGFEVTSANQKLDFLRASNTYAATLRLGVYLPKELADEVQRAMREVDNGNAYICEFDWADRKFKIHGTATFTLKWNTGANAANDCNGLLGYDPGSDDSGGGVTGVSPYLSDSAVAGTHSTAKAWEPIDPVGDTSPVTPQADGVAGKRLSRKIHAVQNRSDGGRRETIYYSTDKLLRLRLKWLDSTDYAKMEELIDWLERGRRISYQPDRSATNVLRLALADPGDLSNSFSWMTRDEVDYPELLLVEQLSRI